MKFKLFGYDVLVTKNDNLVNVPQRNAEQVWVSTDGTETKVADLEVNHMRNIIGLTLRMLKGDNVAYWSERRGRVQYAPIMHDLADDAYVYADDNQLVKVQKPRMNLLVWGKGYVTYSKKDEYDGISFVNVETEGRI